jgi:hypothetical protein
MKKVLVVALVLMAVACGARTDDKSLEVVLNKLPPDVPLYPHGKVSTLDRDLFRVETGEYALVQGVLYFEDAQAKVAGWYKVELERQGWEIVNLHDSLIVSVKNGVHFQLMINQDDARTKVIYFMNPAR